jgi:hypothetical protein
MATTGTTGITIITTGTMSGTITTIGTITGSTGVGSSGRWRDADLPLL